MFFLDAGPIVRHRFMMRRFELGALRLILRESKPKALRFLLRTIEPDTVSTLACVAAPFCEGD